MAPKPEVLIANAALGLGSKSRKSRQLAGNPRYWVQNQLQHCHSSFISENKLSSYKAYQIYHNSVVIPRLQNRQKSRREFQDSNIPELNDQVLAIYKSELIARLNLAVETSHPFVERWVRFWSNHFTVSARSLHLASLSGAFEREAIRPNVFGSFTDLLLASTFHPAMIIYLDNDKSYGPNSPFGRREQKGYNENLAREILELHTMGVDGGYNIDTIKELALALTGWRIDRDKLALTHFSPKLHEPGSRHILDKTIVDEGRKQAIAALEYISNHPSTVKFICRKLISHFVSTAPLPKLEGELCQTFLASSGNLHKMAQTLVSHTDTWHRNEWQYKTPEEFVISVARLFPEVEEFRDVYFPNRLGQPSLRAPTPEGWPSEGKSWINPENLLLRLKWLRRNFRHLSPQVDYTYVVEHGLLGHISNQSLKAIKSMGNRVDRLTAALTSPEFLMR